MRHRSSFQAILLVVVSVLALTGCGDSDLEFLCFITGGFWTDDVYARSGDCEYGGAKSAAASPGDALIIGAAAHVAGAQGTNWRSDLEVHNLADELAVFRVLLLEHGTDNTTPDEVELSLAPGRSLRLGDVLFDEFGVDGSAALILAPTSGRIIVTSRTYNLLGEGNDLGLPAGSTFGQYIPAIPNDEAIRFGEQGRLIQLSHSTATDGGARANLGLVNVSGLELRVKVQLYTAAGEILGIVNRTLSPFEYEQINRIFDRVTDDEVADGYAVVSTSTPGGAFFAYASVVDNLTGDPVAITAARLPSDPPGGAADPFYVVASAHVAGAAGTNWRTDLEVHCWGDEASAYTIELLKHGTNNSNPRTESFTLDAGKSARFEDILETVFGFTGAAALRITPISGALLVSSRTYNLLGEGNDLGLPAGATFGQYIPGVTTAQAIAWGEEGRLIQLSHSTDEKAGFRTNLALVNAADRRIEVKVRLFSADGIFLGTIDRSLAPYEYRQINRVFASVTGGAVEDGYAVVSTITEGGRFFALASVVDNSTGDPVGMVAPVILAEDGQSVLSGVEGVYQVLGKTGLEDFVHHAQDLDVDGLLDVVVMARSEVASLTPAGMVIDYGGGWVAPDGSIHEGSVNIDTSGLSVTSGGINGTVTITRDDYLVDGEPPAIGSTEWAFGLTERADGTVFGEIGISPALMVKQAGDLTGEIEIDTFICPRYPISGFLRLELADQILTINLSSSCHPAFERSAEPNTGGGGGGGGGGGEGDLLAVEWSFEGSTSAVGTIDSATGEWSLIGSSGFPRLNCLARSASGVFYSVTETGSCGRSSLITIDPDTGAGSMVGEISGLLDEHYVSGLAFSPDGALYASVGECNPQVEPVDDLYVINPASASASFVGHITGFEGVGTIDFDETTGTLYGWDNLGGLMAISPGSGSGTDVNPAVVGPNMTSIVVLPDGAMVGGQHNLYGIDPGTGEATLISEGTLSNVRGIEVLD